jgi:DNA-binding CsgD family transcriptional regulator
MQSSLERSQGYLLMRPQKQPQQPQQPPKTQQEFNVMYENLKPRQKESLFPFLDCKTDQEIAEMIYTSKDNVRRHLANIFRVFGLTDSKGDRCRKELIELFLDYRPELVNPALLPTVGRKPKPQPPVDSALTPDIPGRPMALQSPFYIQPTFESRCCEEVLVPGQLIRIRAPQTTGKTSLLYRILHHAEQANYQTIALNLRYDLDASDLTSLATFLDWFCNAIAQRLERSLETAPTTKQGCTRYLQTQILPKLDHPLVLALDEAEVLFEYPEIAREFFALLRGWHEYAKTPGLETIWEKLRLVVVHSTEDYIRLSTAQSPFENVGYVVRLPQLQASQVQALAHRYGLKWTLLEVDRLMQMVGGHPYLVQQALYSVSKQETTLDDLLTTAPTWAGIYRSHLLELSRRLNAMPQMNLAEALTQVIAAEGAVRLKQEQAFQLDGLGLVQFQGNQVQISCELYRRFFQDEL